MAAARLPSDVTQPTEQLLVEYPLPTQRQRIASFIGAVSLCVFAVTVVAAAMAVMVGVPLAAVASSVM